MSLLKIRNLTVEFDTAAGPFRAVDSIDVEVSQREVLAIVGESGSGKSVSMLAVMGLLPDTATITADVMEYDGRDMLKMSDRERRSIIGREISMIFQEPISSLNPSFTCGYQIEEVLHRHLGLKGAAAHKRALELFDQVGIPEPERRLRSYPHQLSGGQCQRVMIAMALLCKPDVLIADEPTTALDVTVQAQIMDLLGELRRELGMATVLITHDLGVVAGFCERAIVMYGGQVMEQSPIDPLFAQPTHPYTRGLLAALPRLDANSTMTPIRGNPPNMTGAPTGCPFCPRCDFVEDICAVKMPPLTTFAAGRARACHRAIEEVAA
jgi:oligopeptide/dipeptide ABC transporter ATP-binding protein